MRDPVKRRGGLCTSQTLNLADLTDRGVVV